MLSVDSIMIQWPDRKTQALKSVKSKQTIVAKQSAATARSSVAICHGEGRTLLLGTNKFSLQTQGE